MTKKIGKKLSVAMESHPETKKRVNELIELSHRSQSDLTLEALNRLVDAELPLYKKMKEMKSNGSQEPETTLGNQIVDLKSSQKQGLSDAEFTVAKKELESDKAKNKRKGGRK